MAYLLCVSSGDSSGDQTEIMSGHTGGRDKVSPQYESSCEPSSFLTWRRTLYTWSRSKESRHYGSSCVSSGSLTQKKLGHTGGRDKVSLRILI